MSEQFGSATSKSLSVSYASLWGILTFREWRLSFLTSSTEQVRNLKGADCFLLGTKASVSPFRSFTSFNVEISVYVMTGTLDFL